MLSAYQIHRAQGQPHHGALRALARRFDMDVDTVGRVIQRAERDEEVLGGKVENLEAQPAPPHRSPARAESHGGNTR